MMPFAFLLPLLLVLLSPAIAQEADDPRIIKDSIYFTLDDGVMTREEMEEEARYVHGLCRSRLYQRLYFDCECIAGAFLNEREKRGPMALQDTILEELFRDGGQTAKCGNGPAIAGEMYRECMDFARYFRRLEDNNEEYCQCTANKLAGDFSSYPYLRIAYIERLRVNAMLWCDRQYPAVRNNF